MHSTSKLAHVASILRKTYGPCPPQRRWDNPLDFIIRTVLSRGAAGQTSERAYTTLRSRFRTWEAVCEAPLKDLVATIRPAGLAHIKAVQVKALLDEIRRQQGHFDLSFLRDLSDEEVRAYLARLKSVGTKTMACAFLFALGRPAFPVDDDVFRVCRRLGLLNGQGTPEKAQTFLEPLVRSRDCHALHVHLVQHGSQVCTTRRPMCDECVLAGLCDHVRRAAGRS